MKFFACGLAISLLLYSAAYAAETSPPPPVVATKTTPSPPSIQLVKRYLTATHYDAQVDRIVAILLPPMMKLVTDSAPDMSADQKIIFTGAVESALAKWVPKYNERIEGEIARIFTDEELEAAIAYYESPPGKSMITKLGAFSGAAVQLSRAMQPDLEHLIGVEVCKRLDCSKVKEPFGTKKS